MKLNFTKFQGTGNDFILIDHRKVKSSSLTRALIAQLCDRRFGIGGDGLILLNSSPTHDFEMKNYNADGGECSMCGNGARCLVQFAHQLAVPSQKNKHYHFMAIDGEHEAFLDAGMIHLKMQDVHELTETPVGTALNTGSPHLVCQTQNLMTFDVLTEGRRLRNSPMFMPAGINVNFVEAYGNKIFVRTYERGVEDETLSCGTGIIAAAITSARESRTGNHVVNVQTRGGGLQVKFTRTENQGKPQWKDIWLVGPAQATFEGQITLPERVGQ